MSKLRYLIFLQLAVVVGLVILLGLAPRPLHTNLIGWDAEWYNSIREHGYSFAPGLKSSTAFFPLFPLVWRLSGLGGIGISLLNLAIASTAIYLLYRHLHLRASAVALFAALPSCMFLYLPYTEALFFFFSSLVLILLARRPVPVGSLAGALAGGAFTRVTAFFYLPALAVVEGVEWLRALATWPERLRRLVLWGVAVGGTLFGVVVLQWYSTGVWFAFNKAEETWGHHLQVPQLPFISTTDNDGALWADGLALFVGILCALWVLREVYRAVRHPELPVPDRLLLFSATYLAAVTWQTASSAPIELGHSSLMSLHRYVFCSPFFLLILNRILPTRAPQPRTVLLGLGLVLVVAATLGVFTSKAFDIEWPTSRIPLLWGPVSGLAYLVALLLYALLWLLSGTRAGRVLVYASSFLLQLFFFYTYSVGHWVG